MVDVLPHSMEFLQFRTLVWILVALLQIEAILRACGALTTSRVVELNLHKVTLGGVILPSPVPRRLCLPYVVFTGHANCVKYRGFRSLSTDSNIKLIFTKKLYSRKSWAKGPEPHAKNRCSAGAEPARLATLIIHLSIFHSTPRFLVRSPLYISISM